MGVPDYTTENLVKTIKRRGSIPTSQNLFTEADFIDIANDEMESNLVPFIMACREAYFQTHRDFAVSTSQKSPVKISIPYNAVGGKLSDVCWVDPQGNLTSIPRLEIPQISGNFMDYTQPNGFYLNDNDVVLFPNLSQGTGTIRMYFTRRPSKLTAKSNAGRIVAINDLTKEVQLSFVPNSWQIGDKLEAQQQVQPFNNTAYDLEITNLSSPTVTLASITGLSVGDWLTQESFAVIPMLPVEAHIVLAQASCVKCLEALGDREGMQAAEAKLEQNKADLLKIITPRVNGSSKKITTAGNGILDWSMTRIRRPW